MSEDDHTVVPEPRGKAYTMATRYRVDSTMHLKHATGYVRVVVSGKCARALGRGETSHMTSAVAQVVARFASKLSNRSCIWGVFHNKIRLINQVVSRPSIA